MELSLLCDASVVLVVKERGSEQVCSYVSNPEDRLCELAFVKVTQPDFTNKDYERIFGCNVKKRKYTRQNKSTTEEFSGVEAEKLQISLPPLNFEQKLKEIKILCNDLKQKKNTLKVFKPDPPESKTNLFFDVPLAIGMNGGQEARLSEDTRNVQSEELKELPIRWLAGLRRSDPPYIFAQDSAKEDVTGNEELWEPEKLEYKLLI
eukprot:TRINITY_DN5377_c0_g1_i4.p1 TRINITY_DN5377_c0_g1~~TRINITY_DN5377_c0_g1_i4.p1  ORF type:complete len:206 (-),score=60.23 TRINITY_DN5377_c0_g1_i4:66-683(-)